MISQWEIARRDSPTRRRYVEWQNGLLTPAAMASARFVELPALRQTGLYRRAALDALRCPVGGGDAETYHDLVEWPIDSDFWYRWFEAGFVAGKVRPRNLIMIDRALIHRFPRVRYRQVDAPPLYRWRQHAGQHTRTQGRCSLASLRACKVHFLLRRGGPAHGAQASAPRTNPSVTSPTSSHLCCNSGRRSTSGRLAAH